MLSLRDEYIKTQLDVTFRQWINKATVFGSLLILLTSFLDILVNPSGFAQSLPYRLGIVLLFTFGYWLNKIQQVYPFSSLLAVFWVAVSTIIIEFMILGKTGSEVRYVIGNIILAIVVIGFLPTRLAYVVAMAFIMFILFLLPIFLGTVILTHINLTLVIIYMLLIHFIMLLMRFISQKSVIQELGMKYDLDQHRNKLEEEVAYRTRVLAHTVESLQREIGERKKAEDQHQALHEQFLQSQKLESVGRLAGGVAHDINNILTTIIGANSLAQMKLPPNHQALEYLSMIDTAGERAANVTRQLLAFSRKQVLDLKVVDMNTVISNTVKMLGRMIGEDVQLQFKPAASLRNVKADKTQIEQVLMNLVVNARDAMPDGGQIVIETENVDGPLMSAGNAAILSNEAHVRLSIRDNGCGMTEEVKQRIFEPFYTTKVLGKGTGLGLATVYGIVMQHKGHVLVESTPGKGTVFHVYLPAVTKDAMETSNEDTLSIPHGRETILVVEDDEAICGLTTEFLSSLGYTVIAASSGEDALLKIESYHHPIDLLLTDVVMPGINGKVLAETVCKTRPSTKVVYISGYTDDKLSDHGVTGKKISLIEKPIRLEQLAVRLRAVLDGVATP